MTLLPSCTQMTISVSANCSALRVLCRSRGTIPGKEVNHMNDFLPKGYETPESEQRYMELAEGTNIILPEN